MTIAIILTSLARDCMQTQLNNKLNFMLSMHAPLALGLLLAAVLLSHH